MLHGVADGLIYGKLPKCPWCDGRSLELEGNLLRCYGYQNGATHCTYKSCVPPPEGTDELFGSAAAPTRTDPTLLKREGAWTLTPTIQRALKGWMPPADAPVHGGAAGAAAGAASGSGSGSSAAGVSEGGKKKAGGKAVAVAAVAAEPESEDEAEVPEGAEMVGMSFACIGALRYSTADLQEMIEAHGGKFVSGSIGDGSVITHLIASEAEARKPVGKQSQKYAAALSGGVPIVSVEYALALCNELEEEEEGEAMAMEAMEADDEVEEVEEVKMGKAAGSGAGGGGGGGGSLEAAIELDTSEDEEEDYQSMKVPDLRERCKQKGLEHAGKKADLVARLVQAAGSPSAASAVAAQPAAKKQKTAAAPSPRKSRGKAAAGSAPSAPAKRAVGALLRQRKHMAAYLLDGGRGFKLASVASCLAKAAARAEKEEAKKPPPRKKLPDIEPKSAVTRVDPEAAMGTAAIYVDSYNLAYNCTLNLMDIRTGVNKYYKMQLLVSGKASKRFTIFKSWGRVGGEEGSGASDGSWRSGRVNQTLKHPHESNRA